MTTTTANTIHHTHYLSLSRRLFVLLMHQLRVCRVYRVCVALVRVRVLFALVTMKRNPPLPISLVVPACMKTSMRVRLCMNVCVRRCISLCVSLSVCPSLCLSVSVLCVCVRTSRCAATSGGSTKLSVSRLTHSSILRVCVCVCVFVYVCMCVCECSVCKCFVCVNKQTCDPSPNNEYNKDIYAQPDC